MLVGVISCEHVLKGVAGGFVQLITVSGRSADTSGFSLPKNVPPWPHISASSWEVH